jgi:micrococcal nuclease
VAQLERTGPTGPTTSATVDRVVDGDTVIVREGSGTERLRYIGMDTPETVKPGTPIEWMGPEASAANKALVDERNVVLEKDVSERDRYGRLLRNVWLRDGDRWVLVGLQLVLDGYAQVTTFPPDVKYVDALLAAQGYAMAQSKGLWRPTPAP